MGNRRFTSRLYMGAVFYIYLQYAFMPDRPASDPRISEGLDPELIPFIEGIEAAYGRFPVFATLDTTRQRQFADVARTPWADGGPQMHRSTNRVVGQLLARVHAPRPGVLSAMIYLHGGGWTFNSLDTHDRLMREYAARSGVTVIGIEYPLAPETKFPNQITMLTELVRLLANRGDEWGVDPGRLAIGGDCAGANLALATALALRENNYGDALSGLLLNYGAFDACMQTESYAQFGDGRYLLTPAAMDRLWMNYLRDGSQRADPFVSPVNADLRNLPPTFMTIADLDVLRDENLAVRARLEAAGVPVEGRVYPGSVHSFLDAVSICMLSSVALDEAASWLAERLGSTR